MVNVDKLGDYMTFIPLGKNILCKSREKKEVLSNLGVYLPKQSDQDVTDVDTWDTKILDVDSVGEEVIKIVIGDVVIVREGSFTPVNNEEGEILGICHEDDVICKRVK